MVSVKKSWKIFWASLGIAALLVSFSSAAIPSNYKGVPYPLGSEPKEIPGRINFHDYDKGGPGVSFVQDDMASGHWGGCCAGLRDTGIYADGDPDHPSFTRTNLFGYPPDTFYAAGVSYPNGVRFPSPDTSYAANDWYIGACHPNNWFNVTVHVSKAGKYWISAFWAAMETTIQYHIKVMGAKDTLRTNTINLTGYNSYHAWRKYADFASITLDTGVRVMQFYNESYHLNQDYLFFASDSGHFPTEMVQPSVKTAHSRSFDLSINRETVRFTLPNAGKTKVTLFDCLGRAVMTVLDRDLYTGIYTVSLNTEGLKQGIYFVRIDHGGMSGVAKFQQNK